MCLRQELGVNSPLLVVSAMSCLINYKTLINLKKQILNGSPASATAPQTVHNVRKAPLDFS